MQITHNWKRYIFIAGGTIGAFLFLSIVYDLFFMPTFHVNTIRAKTRDFFVTTLDINGPYALTEEQAELKQTTPTPQTSIPKPLATPQTPAPLPAQARLAVPFLAQAPFANWDALHEEACEEAAMIMVKHFLQNQPITSLQQEDQEIIANVRYQEQNGYRVDTSIPEVADIMQAYYGIGNARVETTFTVEDIKRELASGKPVIVPAYGKILPNPFFKNGGPDYHMLVIIGYDEKGFITNDPGIRQGANFRYTYTALYNAINDWDTTANRLSGQKAYLVFD